MTTVSVSLPSDGSTASVSQYNTPITTIVSTINGNLDSTNISSITGTKITAGTIPGSALDTNTAAGWLTGLAAPNTVTYNGNHSYSLVFNSVNYSTSLSPGMRLRSTRTVAAPTQCTSLNGTSQYYSKTSPAGMTFTVTCTAMGARKLNVYSAQWFGGRTTGTNGFRYGINANGQLIFEVQPGNATTKTVTSYQSVPLNKWFRFAFQIDLAGTCQIMLDGVPIPSTTAGSATSLTQAAADFQLGAAGGTGFTNGKIAQDALFSAKLADATVQSYESQSYAGTETSLISAYSFNNTINDLNTTNANNLTANGSAVATTADSPFGGQAGGTISPTLDYGIVQSATFSTNTTVVVQVPEGCTIPTSGGVSAVVYSSNKAPYGLPAQLDKWRIASILNLTSSLNTTSNATYGNFNGGAWALNVPVGGWDIGWMAQCYNGSATVVNYNISPTSLVGMTATAGYLTSRYSSISYAPTGSITTQVHIRAPQTLASSQTYVMYTLGTTTVAGLDTNSATEIFAENTYL